MTWSMRVPGRAAAWMRLTSGCGSAACSAARASASISWRISESGMPLTCTRNRPRGAAICAVQALCQARRRSAELRVGDGFAGGIRRAEQRAGKQCEG